jgi:hypothetical protein
MGIRSMMPDTRSDEPDRGNAEAPETVKNNFQL